MFQIFTNFINIVPISKKVQILFYQFCFFLHVQIFNLTSLFLIFSNKNNTKLSHRERSTKKSFNLTKIIGRNKTLSCDRLKNKKSNDDYEMFPRGQFYFESIILNSRKNIGEESSAFSREKFR